MFDLVENKYFSMYFAYLICILFEHSREQFNNTLDPSGLLRAGKLEVYIVRLYGEHMAKWHWYVYIIECLDGTYYTGMTWNISNRLDQHISRLGSKYTARHGVKKLVYYEEFDDFEIARKREKQIKDWNQTKKRKLISDEWKKEW